MNKETNKNSQYYDFWWHICEEMNIDVTKHWKWKEKNKKLDIMWVNKLIFESIKNNDVLTKNVLLCSYFMFYHFETILRKKKIYRTDHMSI